MCAKVWSRHRPGVLRPVSNPVVPAELLKQVANSLFVFLTVSGNKSMQGRDLHREQAVPLLSLEGKAALVFVAQK